MIMMDSAFVHLDSAARTVRNHVSSSYIIAGGGGGELMWRYDDDSVRIIGGWSESISSGRG